MGGTGHIVVLDVGKTMAKLSLWSRTGERLARQSRSNAVIDAGAYRALDAAGIEDWLAKTLAEFARMGPIDAIIPVAHGAGAAIIRNGALAASPLDYEENIPADMRDAYDARRPSFSETGSPRLPAGLNLGAQLHWLETLDPSLLDDAQILPWPQYWAWRLCGVTASEVSSLGCHTDLWAPAEGGPSSFCVTRGWADKLAPQRRAGDRLGAITPEWRARCVIEGEAAVLTGLHDSNAAFLAARAAAGDRAADFTLISTGTWFVAMRAPGPGAQPAALAETRDCLINVDVDGRPVPSARLMGGREIELLTDDASFSGMEASPKDAETTLRNEAMFLPSAVNGVGPFPQAEGRWLNRPQDASARRAAASLYAALLTDAALGLIGARETLVVEGRFAADPVYTGALAALRPGDNVLLGDEDCDVAYGALLLADPNLPRPGVRTAGPLGFDVAGYARKWRRETSCASTAA